MNSPCGNCGLQLESPWSFCPHCGSRSAPAVQAPAPVHDHENAPVKGAFGGLVLGVIVAPVLIIVGGMLCLTGLGAFAGVPMIIAGFCSPLLGPMLGISAIHGKCPWCGVEVSSVAPLDGFCCEKCNGKIAVKRRELVRAQ